MLRSKIARYFPCVQTETTSSVLLGVQLPHTHRRLRRGTSSARSLLSTDELHCKVVEFYITLIQKWKKCNLHCTVSGTLLHEVVALETGRRADQTFVY